MQGITYNVTSLLKGMVPGQVEQLHAMTKESTVRNVCTRLSKETPGRWTCRKIMDAMGTVTGYEVSRTQ